LARTPAQAHSTSQPHDDISPLGKHLNTAPTPTEAQARYASCPAPRIGPSKLHLAGIKAMLHDTFDFKQQQ
jgi:hypothetical protein